MDLKFISIIAAALAVSIGSIGPALAEGRSVAAAMDAIARQPEAAGTISRTLFVGLAMIETMAISGGSWAIGSRSPSRPIPRLLAGAELHFPAAILRFSVTSELAALRAEVETDDDAR